VHNWICYGMFLSGILVFCFLMFSSQQTPYGRYSEEKKWGPLINAKLAWITMEMPNLVLAAVCFLSGEKPNLTSLPNLILSSAFVAHYINRTLVFPMRMRSGKPMPLSIMIMAFTFCCINGYLQARYLCSLKVYNEDWLADGRFLFGITLFLAGFAINMHSDGILRKLRTNNSSGYKIPRGGMFEYVSGANFFGEIVEWTGFTFAGWSLPATAFAFFTFCNIGPRAIQHHEWYQQKFKEDYPKCRKALIPFLW